MLNKWKTLFTGLLFVAAFGQSMAQIELKIGNLTVAPSDIPSATCIQVPIYINDTEMSDRDIRTLTVTVALSGSAGVIDGGLEAPVLVSNAFVDTGGPGIANPGVDLVSGDGFPSPTCSAVINQATLGTGSTADFPAEVAGAPVMSITNTVGGDATREQLFLFDFGGQQVISLTQNVDTLVGVLEIPVVVNPMTGFPDPSQILVTAVPEADVAGGNAVNLDGGGFMTLDLPAEPSAINIFEAVDCAGATATPEVTWADPNDGGIGGEIDFNFPGTAGIDQVDVVGIDGFAATVPATDPDTTLSIDTTNDASPDPADSTLSYDITYEVEFPPASGTYVGGASCTVTPAWAAPTAELVFDAVPVLGQPTNLDVTLTNAMWDGTKYGTVTLPDMSTVDLTAPTSGAGTNVLVFQDVVVIASVSATDVGPYTATGDGPGSQTYNGTTALTLEPPVNETVCGDITEGTIGGSVTIPLAGNDGTVDFTVVYNGVTYDNLPEGDFDLFGVVGDVNTVIITANGFTAGGDPATDSTTCTFNYVDPTCNNATQNPDTTVTPVDVGTVITLDLDTVNAVSVTINGVAMTPDVDPDTNANVSWTASHTAVADQTLIAIVTDGDGDFTTCSWTIDINCVDPVISEIGGVGSTGITVYGTLGCTYTVRFTSQIDGTMTDYDVLVDTPASTKRGGGVGFGYGYLDVVIPPDTLIEVGQAGLAGGASGSVLTVPTLGEWGLIAFITMLMGVGIAIRRRNA